MFYALTWLVVLLLLAFWSLAAWSVNALGAWVLSSAGSVSGTAAGGDAVRVPEWLAPWIPSELEPLLASATASLSALLAGAPEKIIWMTGGLSVAVLIVWGLGAVLLIGCGVLMHVWCARWSRPAPPPAPGSGSLVAG